jgi:neutral trehalase
VSGEPLRIGAYDAAAWAGLVFSDRPGRGFGLRLAIERDGGRAEGADFEWLVHEVGPNAPDGAYARMAFDTGLPVGRGAETPILARRQRHADLVFEWTRRGASVAARIRAGFVGALEVETYLPWDFDGLFSTDGAALLGRSGDRGAGFALQAVARDAALRALKAGAPRAALRFEVGPDSVVYLVAALAAAREEAHAAAREGLEPAAIDAALAAAADSYEAKRAAVDGHWEGLAAAITNNLHWMVLLQPEKAGRYVPAGRRWIFPAPEGRDHWTIFEWDGFFAALQLAVESPELAKEALGAVLATQYENGNVPNWRSRFSGTKDRSQPPVGSFTALKLFHLTGDLSILETAFPFLERWSAWWRAPRGKAPRRDGNASGLFEWGSDPELATEGPARPGEPDETAHARAAWESGQDDLPCWEQARLVPETGTFDLESVDLNALLVLDDECLGAIAAALGLPERASFYAARAESHRRLVNERLWCEEEGLYLDRRWNGRFLHRPAASHFYPLLAGIPGPERAARLVKALRDPARFWGEWVLPTVGRDDPAFADQQLWRGSIWPPTNYLVAHGLRRYGCDELAGELASKSVALFLRNWRRYQVCRENFDSRTGEGSAQRHQGWGPLLCLLGLEEFVDVSLWDGLRLGSLAPPPESTVRRLRRGGHEWEVTLDPRALYVTMDARPLLRTSGPVVLRNVEAGPGLLAARTHAPQPVTITMAGEGLWAFEVDGAAVGGARAAVDLPPGRHALRAKATGS